MLQKVALTILLALAVAISLAAPAEAKQNPKFLVAIGQETIVRIEPGRVECIGGQPTGQYYPDPQCTPGTDQILVRGEVDYTQFTDVTGTAAAMFEGATNRIVVNCNFDANLKGDCWGTFEITVPGQGKWEGAWSGPFDLTNLVAFYSVVGHGSEGQLHRLHMKYDAIYPGTTWYATFVACVTDKDGDSER